MQEEATVLVNICYHYTKGKDGLNDSVIQVIPDISMNTENNYISSLFTGNNRVSCLKSEWENLWSGISVSPVCSAKDTPWADMFLHRGEQRKITFKWKSIFFALLGVFIV